MANKWYSSFVSFEAARPEAAESQAAPAPAQTVAGIAALMDSGQPPPAPAGTFASSGHFYEFAGTRTPAHRCDIIKVAAMLDREPVQSHARGAKRRTAALALEAAGAALPDAIRYAIRRDRAPDARETSKRRRLSEFGLAKAGGSRQLRADIGRLEARTEGNAAEILRQRERFFLRLPQKRREEQIFAEAVSYFVTEKSDHYPPGGAGRESCAKRCAGALEGALA